MVQDPSNERPLKRRRLAHRDDNMRWVQSEIADIKETLEEMASEAREGRQHLISTLEELDFAGIKESLDEMTYDAREERDNLHSMLEELLAEVQDSERE
jgi:predicted AlkP superfamily pyrophosphatase or phosphodiesterase